jgi:hypothetical protein
MLVVAMLLSRETALILLMFFAPPRSYPRSIPRDRARWITDAGSSRLTT